MLIHKYKIFDYKIIQHTTLNANMSVLICIHLNAFCKGNFDHPRV